MILLRGFAKQAKFPQMSEVYLLEAGAIASYPMYRGLARLIGMEILPTGTTIKEEFTTLKNNFEKYDFFYLHIKESDSAGEDGDFERKRKVIEDVDKHIPDLLNLKPGVIVVTGDHSTPSLCKAHSWHSVPLLLYSKWARAERRKEFSEKSCACGYLGRIPATTVMPLALANARRLRKYGA
jgi:2,3-bisphosphoglycerate-independent phosphoglycerate mutase